jgi:hypothetical protein
MSDESVDTTRQYGNKRGREQEDPHVQYNFSDDETDDDVRLVKRGKQYDSGEVSDSDVVSTESSMDMISSVGEVYLGKGITGTSVDKTLSGKNDKTILSRLKSVHDEQSLDQEYVVDCYVCDTTQIHGDTLRVSVYWEGFSDQPSQMDVITATDIKVSDHVMHSFVSFLSESPSDWRLACLFFSLYPPTTIVKRFIQKTVGLWILDRNPDKLYRFIVKSRNERGTKSRRTFSNLLIGKSEIINGPFDLKADFDKDLITYKGIPIAEICGVEISACRISNPHEYKSIEFPR